MQHSKQAVKSQRIAVKLNDIEYNLFPQSVRQEGVLSAENDDAPHFPPAIPYAAVHAANGDAGQSELQPLCR